MELQTISEEDKFNDQEGVTHSNCTDASDIFCKLIVIYDANTKCSESIMNETVSNHCPKSCGLCEDSQADSDLISISLSPTFSPSHSILKYGNLRKNETSTANETEPNMDVAMDIFQRSKLLPIFASTIIFIFVTIIFVRYGSKKEKKNKKM
mmetsp:Transcript_17058/g.38382  ORF Transcript_17058/g.38382 Transcript_17058/m.38382 type:complete len:152 (-) Transcript_17058:69-524(-)